MKKTAFIFLAVLFFAGGAYAEKVRIGYPSAGALINGQIGHILEKTNILEMNGLTAEITPFPNGAPMQEALLAGHIDVALTSEANFVNLASKFPCRVIASFGSAGRIALMVKDDSPIKNTAGLKGKTVTTVFGTSAHYPAVQWLLKAGLDPEKDVKLVHMASGSRAALLTGDVDALVTWDPNVEDMVQKKIGRVLEANPAYWTITVVSEKFLKEQPEDAVKFLVALHEAALFMAANKDLANGWLSATMAVPADIIAKGSSYNENYSKAKKLKDVKLTPSADLIKRLQQIADFNLKNGLLKAPSPVKEKTDLSFAKAAAAKVKTLKYDPASVVVKSK